MLFQPTLRLVEKSWSTKPTENGFPGRTRKNPIIPKTVRNVSSIKTARWANQWVDSMDWVEIQAYLTHICPVIVYYWL